jgi:hypothetical protein
MTAYVHGCRMFIRYLRPRIVSNHSNTVVPRDRRDRRNLGKSRAHPPKTWERLECVCRTYPGGIPLPWGIPSIHGFRHHEESDANVCRALVPTLPRAHENHRLPPLQFSSQPSNRVKSIFSPISPPLLSCPRPPYVAALIESLFAPFLNHF